MRLLRHTVLVALAILAPRAAAVAQTRERPVPFDPLGRVMVITPPLAARFGLGAPLWPVSGDYLDARLYSLDDSARAFVLVVRRREDVLERTPMDSVSRVALAREVERGDREARLAARNDSSPTYISEPVRGTFVANQAMLGALLFGPAAAITIQDPVGSSTGYLLVTGATIFTAAGIASAQPISRAQNHLAWHTARRGAIAADLTWYALTGDHDDRNYAAAALVGGLAGDITGFQLAAPMTDAEAHGASHGSTVAALLTAGAFGVAGSLERGPSTRVASGAIVGAGILGYPLGLSYVRGAPYRVTAGDIGTMTITGLLGIGAGAALIPDRASPATTYGLLTAGYAAGVIVGDRALVRPFDHSESDARILGLGTAAGALMGLALPVATQARDSRVFWGAITAGGALGLLTAEQLLAPPRARPGDRSTGSDSGARGGDRPARVGVHIAPESIVMAAMGQRGRHSVLSLSF